MFETDGGTIGVLAVVVVIYLVIHSGRLGMW